MKNMELLKLFKNEISLSKNNFISYLLGVLLNFSLKTALWGRNM